jgi:hypothetical protein
MLHEMLLDDDGAGPPTTASFSMLMLLAGAAGHLQRTEDNPGKRRFYWDRSQADLRLLLHHDGLQALTVPNGKIPRKAKKVVAAL